MLADIYDFYEEAEQAARGRYAEEPSLQDDLDEFRENLALYFSNLKGYRAHLVHKNSEAAHDKEFYHSKNLTEIDVVVISDWKMKILSSKYRESQQEWFSKRGISLLGFEIHLRFDDDSKQVLYHFFLTDDTLQNTEAVLCAKHFLYTKVLPHYNVQRVHFKSDGAGCYSSKEAKGGMVFFGNVAEQSLGAAYEVSYKVSVAGCGSRCKYNSFYISFSICYTYCIVPFVNRVCLACLQCILPGW